MIRRLGAGALCRIDDELIRRIRSERDLRSTVYECIAMTCLGLVLYGASMGYWRGITQTYNSSLKLLLVFGGMFAFTTTTNFVLSALMRTHLTTKQVAMSTLVGITTTAIILGAIAPISWLIACHAPAFVDDLIGSNARGAEYQFAFKTSRLLLTWHVLVISGASYVGVRRTARVLNGLIVNPHASRRVLLAWLLTEGLVGSELSWLMRPFVGTPHLPVTFFREDAFERSIVEGLYSIATTALGSVAVDLLLIVAIGLTLQIILDGRSRLRAVFEHRPDGLDIQPMGRSRSFSVPWHEVHRIARRGSELEIIRRISTTFEYETLVSAYPSEEQARTAFEAFELARSGVTAPYRRSEQ